MEQRVQKALNFLKNPKVSSLPYEKKIEFLKSKLTPAEMEEVLKRAGDSLEFNKFFEPASTGEQQVANKWNFKVLAGVGAVIIGAIASAFFTNKSGKSDSQESEEIKSLIDAKFTAQKESTDLLMRQIAELQFNLEIIKKNQEETRKVDMVEESLKKGEEEKVVEEGKNEGVEENIIDVQEVFSNCFNGFSDSNKGLALKTMKMWFSNIVNSPGDKTKARINITNPQYKNYFAGNPAAEKLFESVGFTLSGNFLEFDTNYINTLKLMLDKITENINNLPSQVFSNSAPWQIARPAAKKEEKPEEKSIDKSEEVKASSEEPNTEKSEEIKVNTEGLTK